MKKETVEQVMAKLKSCIEELNESIRIVQELCEPGELKHTDVELGTHSPRYMTAF